MGCSDSNILTISGIANQGNQVMIFGIQIHTKKDRFLHEEAPNDANAIAVIQFSNGAFEPDLFHRHPLDSVAAWPNSFRTIIPYSLKRTLP